MDRKEYAAYCRKIAAEGCVLLENDGALPLKPNDKVAIFGREQFEYVKSGSGSGGRVNAPYTTDLNSSVSGRVIVDKEVEDFYKDYIKNNPYDPGDGWKVPPVQKQPTVEESFVRDAAARCDKAVIAISRVCGESFDMQNVRGDFLLTEEEERTIELVTRYFKKTVVVLNSGNIINLTVFKKYKINGLLLCWQGGQEGGAALADVLVGAVAPSGKLPMTIAEPEAYGHIPFGEGARNIHFEDIFVGYRYFLTFAPDKIVYPFGFGLGYTTFKIETRSFAVSGGSAKLSVYVENIGDYKGREVVEVYFSAPQGKLGKAAKELIAYKKTKELLPGEGQTVEISFEINEMSAFDDKNACGFGHSFVMEKGDYAIFVGNDCLHNEKVGVYTLDNDILIKKASDALHPRQSFTRLTAFGTERVDGYECDYPTEEAAAVAYTGDRGLTLKNVADGVCSMDDFIGQFTVEQLFTVVRGESWGSRKTKVIGTAAVMGGKTEPFAEHGVPVVTLCDGPAGPSMYDPDRMDECKDIVTTCIPSGTLLASTWDEEGLEPIFRGFSDEMKEYGVDIILGPGVNIHRHPFGGRNFEYFSEDPRLAGNFNAAICGYFWDNDVICTPKHFAVNSQEHERGGEDEILSERALREIYLKVFELAVRTGKVQTIMTSYNRVNGVSTCASVGLTDVILRREWGFDGLVMSDWGARADKFSNGKHDSCYMAEMIIAQNDIYMGGNDSTRTDNDLAEEYANGSLTLGMLQRSARRVLECVIKSQTFKNV